MQQFKLLLALILFLIAPLTLAANQTLYYEPNIVTLKGHIISLTFPGPPNYESIKKGDKAERGPYLILDNPIDIAISPNDQSKDNSDEPKNNVKLIQLIVMNDKDWKAIKDGNYVSITGPLSSSITGHHHARALLTVKQVTVLSKEKLPKNAIDTITVEDKQNLKEQNR